MQRKTDLLEKTDWLTIAMYLALVAAGWVSIYAASYEEGHRSIFDLSQNSGKQFIWICISFILGFCILLADARLFEISSFLIYGLVLLALVAVLFFGKTVSGSRSWFEIGFARIQPSEFAKFATALALAAWMSRKGFHLKYRKELWVSLLLILLPAGLILLQGDAGSALVYAGFMLVLFREGLNPFIPALGVILLVLFLLALIVHKIVLMGILLAAAVLAAWAFRKKWKRMLFFLLLLAAAAGFVQTVDYGFYHLLRPHQQERINVLLGRDVDIKGAAYNVHQSKIAIGSGGLLGKGFLKGTQTRYNFVPEESTDFIFCTIGEEWGFLGAASVMLLFLGLLLRIIYLAERQRLAFARIYGYGAAAILFLQFAVNVGMTISLAPVIGIPFPFVSYGGSAMLSLTALLFVFIRLEAGNLKVFAR